MKENKIKFYRVECELTNWNQRFVNDEGKIMHFFAAMYSEQVYYESNSEYHVCLSRIFRRKKMHFCILSSDENKNIAFKHFIDLSGLDVKDIVFYEIDKHDGYRMLKASQSRGFGINENIIFKRFELDAIFPTKNSQKIIIESK